jgi:hypothetical protein
MTKSGHPVYRGLFRSRRAFTEGGDLDLEGQRGALDCMIDQGVDGSAFWPTFRAIPAVGQGARH